MSAHDRATPWSRCLPAQKADPNRLPEERRDRSSPKVHQWLTPEQFGNRFGLTSGDYAAATGWLESHGPQIEYAARARNWVAFSGAAQDGIASPAATIAVGR